MDIFNLWLLEVEMDGGVREKIHREFALAQTFERLDLTHTCCRWMYDLPRRLHNNSYDYDGSVRGKAIHMDEEEVKEMQDEELELIEKLH
jgi:hypothetical protein